MEKVQISSNINCFTFLNYDDEIKCQFKQSSILVIYSVPSRWGGSRYKLVWCICFSLYLQYHYLSIVLQINLSDEVQIALKRRVMARHIFLYINTILI